MTLGIWRSLLDCLVLSREWGYTRKVTIRVPLRVPRRVIL